MLIQHYQQYRMLNRVTLVFAVDSTKGWLDVHVILQALYRELLLLRQQVVTITTVCTNFKVHTFTGSGTFQATAGAGPLAVVDYLVAAGGGGRWETWWWWRGGGFRESKVVATSGCWTASPLAATSLPVTQTSYPITVVVVERWCLFNSCNKR